MEIIMCAGLDRIICGLTHSSR